MANNTALKGGHSYSRNGLAKRHVGALDITDDTRIVSSMRLTCYAAGPSLVWKRNVGE